jgi:hypothetical protein
MATEATWRELCTALEGAEEGASYGTPAFRVGKTLFTRLHQDGGLAVVKCELSERDALLDAFPGKYFVTAHYEPYPWMLVRLGAVSKRELKQVLTEAWREAQPAGRGRRATSRGARRSSR